MRGEQAADAKCLTAVTSYCSTALDYVQLGIPAWVATSSGVEDVHSRLFTAISCACIHAPAILEPLRGYYCNPKPNSQALYSPFHCQPSHSKPLEPKHRSARRPGLVGTIFERRAPHEADNNPQGSKYVKDTYFGPKECKYYLLCVVWIHRDWLVALQRSYESASPESHKLSELEN